MTVLERNFNLSQRMTHELGRAIVCGEFDRRRSLPTEADLCEKYGISRTAVREAVKMLSAKGLISSRPRQGIRILPEEEWNIFDSDLLSWSLQGKPSLRVLKEFLQMRIAIEPEAAALGARYRKPGRLVEVADALMRMEAAGNNHEAALVADIDFHIAVLYSSENRFFIRMRDFVRTALNASIRHTNMLKADQAAIVEEHARVLRAMEQGDAEEAKRAMFFLIEEALGFIDQAIAATRA